MSKQHQFDIENNCHVTLYFFDKNTSVNQWIYFWGMKGLASRSEFDPFDPKTFEKSRRVVRFYHFVPIQLNGCTAAVSNLSLLVLAIHRLYLSQV